MVTDRSLLHRLGPLAPGAAALLVAAALLAGCGDKEAADARQGLGGERFEQVRFQDVPRPARIVVKDKKATDALQTEQFELTGVSPAGVMDYYVQTLVDDGWTAAEPVAETRDGLQGRWLRQGRSLVVQAREAAVTDPAVAPPIQVDLTFFRLDRPGG